MPVLLIKLTLAALVGSGMLLGSQGYRIIRFNCLSQSVFLLGTAGAVIGAWFESPPVSLVLGATGALLGYRFNAWLFYIHVALGALVGGAALGLILSLWRDFSNPSFVCIATAAGTAALALLYARPVTILWTSLVGAAIATTGVLLSTFDAEKLRYFDYVLQARKSLVPYALMAGFIFALQAAAGAAFQFWTTREASSATEPALRPAKAGAAA